MGVPCEYLLCFYGLDKADFSNLHSFMVNWYGLGVTMACRALLEADGYIRCFLIYLFCFELYYIEYLFF